MYADSKGMLRDLVAALREANMPPSGLVWLAIWPGILRGHARR
jgi:hypothetical protein